MDYSKLSDGEINLLVAKYLGRKTEPTLRENSQAVYERLEGGWGLMHDYCNNPSDAWPIIEKYRISFLDQLTEWCVDAKGVSPVFEANPLRGAMIVFLMMQDSANVQDNTA